MNSLDTLGYCKRLEAVGVPREQAEVHAQILTEVMSQVATKDDLKDLEVRMKEWVTLYVQEQVAELKADMAGLKADLVKWLFAVSVAQASLIIAALRYLPH